MTVAAPNESLAEITAVHASALRAELQRRAAGMR
jgi:hypothetical protein